MDNNQTKRASKNFDILMLEEWLDKKLREAEYFEMCMTTKKGN